MHGETTGRQQTTHPSPPSQMTPQLPRARLQLRHLPPLSKTAPRPPPPPPKPPPEKQPQGFNAIRLPFIFKDLKSQASQIGGYCQGASTAEEIARRTVDPAFKGPITKKPPAPVVPLPTIDAPGKCNCEGGGGRAWGGRGRLQGWCAAVGHYGWQRQRGVCC